MKLLRIESGNIISNFRIIAFDNKYILTDKPIKNKILTNFVYTGDDSFFLISNLKKSLEGKKILDIGTGPAIVPIIFAKKNRFIVGVDINNRAIKIAKANLILNDIVKNRIELIISDLARCFKENIFDSIISNFPFIPIIPGVKYPLFGNGGRTGYAVLERSIQDIDSTLKPNKSFYGLVMSIGDNKKSFISDMINKKMNNLSLKVTLIEIDKIHINLLIYSLRRWFNIDIKQWKKYYMRQKCNYIYYYYILIKKYSKFEINILEQKLKVLKKLFNYVSYIIDFSILYFELKLKNIYGKLISSNSK